MSPRWSAWSALSAAAFSFVLCANVHAQKTPEETVATLKVPDGMEIKLWASEPGMVNPTNMDIDERGRVWITEAANYRGSVTRPEGDRIMILEDTDADGKADSYKVFFQDKSLFAPLGICKVGNKLYVSQSPNIIVFTIDESGDKPVGKPQVVYTGWTGENHDHGVHAMTFGPDGRLYFNSGNSGTGGTIKDVEGKAVIDSLGSSVCKGDLWRGAKKPGNVLGYQEGMAFRVNPDGSGFETLGFNFRNNYEVAPDSFGTAWQSDNDDDGNQGVRINYVMEGGNFGYHGPKGNDWGRDQGVFPGQTKQEAHWHQRWPGVVPNLLNTGGGSPTGICVYEGNLLGDAYDGAIIHCDAGPNVVRAYIPTPSGEAPTGIMEINKKPATSNGAGYAAEAIELVKGADNWFRPADVCTAPDGAIFIADWYDPGVGGHATGDRPNQGGLKGRVYRLAPKGNKPAKVAFDVSNTAGAIAALQNPNLAVRYAAYTKLASDAGSTAALKDLLKNDKNPRFRARALWLLARSADGKAAITEALGDQDANIRITALRAARMIKMDMPEIAKKLIDDKSMGVLRELCLAMNYETAEKAVPVLVMLADKYDGKDRWYLEALGIGANGKEKELLEAWNKEGKQKGNADVAKGIEWRLKMENPTTANAAKVQFIESWYALAPFEYGAGQPALDKDFGPDAKAGAIDLTFNAKGVGGKEIKWEKVGTIDINGTKIVDFVSYCQKHGSKALNVVGYFTTVIVSPEDQKATLILGSDDATRTWLNGKEVQKNDQTRALNFGDDNVKVELKKGQNVLLVKLRQGNGLSGVAAAVVADKKVTFADPSSSADAGANAPASAAAKEPSSAPTAYVVANEHEQKAKDGTVLPTVAKLVEMKGDPKHGAEVFRNAKGANCIRCHQIANEGEMIGPPLTTIGQKLSKAQLYESILYPSNGILMEFESWVVRTKKGKTFTGLKVTDTPVLFSVKDTEGKYHDIEPDQIDKKVMQKISIMPEGLSATMTQQDLLDVVEYLSTLRNPF